METDWETRATRLQAELEEVREEVKQLEQLLAPLQFELPLEMGIGVGQQYEILRALYFHGKCSKELLQRCMTPVYQPREERGPKALQVVVSNLRTKLNRFGIKIETMWAWGYTLEPSEKKKLDEWVVIKEKVE